MPNPCPLPCWAFSPVLHAPPNHTRAFAQVFQLLCLWLREWRTAHTSDRAAVDPTSPHPHSAPLPRPPARPGQGGWWGPSDAPPACPLSAAAHLSQCRCRPPSKQAAPTAQQKCWEAPLAWPECSSLSPVASLAWQAPGSCSERPLPADEPPVRLEAVGWLCGDACVSGPRSVLGLHAHPAQAVTWGPGAVPLHYPALLFVWVTLPWRAVPLQPRQPPSLRRRPSVLGAMGVAPQPAPHGRPRAFVVLRWKSGARPYLSASAFHMDAESECVSSATVISHVGITTVSLQVSASALTSPHCLVFCFLLRCS